MANIPSNSVHLIFEKNPERYPGKKYVVTDANGNIKFTVQPTHPSVRKRHVLSDAEGNPILTIRQKSSGANLSWKVMYGEKSFFDIFSRNDGLELAFTACVNIPFQTSTDVLVFLSENEYWDYKVLGTWFQRSCIIREYRDRDSRFGVAKIHKKTEFGVEANFNQFDMYIGPNIKQEFVAAIVVILYEMHNEASIRS